MKNELTWVFGVLGADILVTSIEHILIHKSSAWSDLSEEADLDRLTNLDPLALLHEYLPCVLAAVLAVQAGNTILLRVVTFLEGLESSHEVVTTGNAGSNNTFGNTCSDGTLDDGGD